MDRTHKQLDILFFLLYCVCLFLVLFHRESYDTGLPYWEQVALSVNFRPFHTVRLYLRLLARGRLTHLAVVNLVGNLVLFVPLGFFLPRLFSGLRRLWKTALLCACIISMVEICQVLLLVGSCDVDDLIFNLIGVTAGYGIYRFLKP